MGYELVLTIFVHLQGADLSQPPREIARFIHEVAYVDLADCRTYSPDMAEHTLSHFGNWLLDYWEAELQVDGDRLTATYQYGCRPDPQE